MATVEARKVKKSYGDHPVIHELDLSIRSGEFMVLLQERFAEWGLTPSEKDVALFAIKGMSTAEIASLRSTSEGTVKAQTNAIYRKAGVTGRPQLLSVFIEDLMEKGGMAQPKQTQVPRTVVSAK